jgi:biopolymer transport protein ExbD/uncharacterized membrane protein
MPGLRPNSWQTYGCEWTLRYLWRWTNLFERLDLIVLALMLALVVVVVVRVSYRYRLARRAEVIETASEAFHRARKKLATDLRNDVGSLRSIAFTAPYLGLAGTCVGMLSAFKGVGMQRHAAMAMMASGIAAATITTGAGLLVAVPAVLSYNYLRTCIDSLENEFHSKARRSLGFQFAQGLPLAPRFSKIPFAVIAAPALAITLGAFLTFASFHTSSGLPVRLVKIGVVHTEHFSVEPIVIEIIDTGGSDPPTVYVNSKKTPSDKLVNRLRSERKVRPQGLAYVHAENNVLWGDVVNVIDVVEELQPNVVLLTITPNFRLGRRSIR